MGKILGPEDLDEPVILFVRRDYTPLQVEQTVGQALERLRSRKIGEKIIYFYVVDREGKLVGVVPTRRLLMSDLTAPITSIMVDRVVTIPSSATVLTACEFFILHRLLAFPVVDEENRLMGVVDVNLFTDEVFTMAQKRSAESAFQIIGVHVALGRQGSLWVSFKDRFPWLLCNIAGGMACALLAAHYEAFIDAVIVLAFFIPVVLTLSESVSIQSMSITLQTLQLERVNWKLAWNNLRKEFIISVLLGAACGLVVGGVAAVWKGDGMVALAIGVSIALSMVTACMMGVVIPALVRALRGDPKFAAGPVVLAMADVATLLFYLHLSATFLGRR